MKRILIMGLPGSGKTMLAEELHNILECPWFNADSVREQFNDWDFSLEGRIRQAYRMRSLADATKSEYVICDFVCPLEQMRDIFDAFYTVWVDTETESEFIDTNTIFELPIKYNYRIFTKESKKWAPILAKHIKETK